jgi:hypothetical protein
MWFKSKREPEPPPLTVESVSRYRVGGKEFASGEAARDYAKNHERRQNLAREVARHLKRIGGYETVLYNGQLYEIITYLETQTIIRETK